jgi:hypothetical protein
METFIPQWAVLLGIIIACVFGTAITVGLLFMNRTLTELKEDVRDLKNSQNARPCQTHANDIATLKEENKNISIRLSELEKGR